MFPVYKNNFYGGNKHFESKSDSHGRYTSEKKSKNKRKQRLVRTSTPVPELENTPVSSFSDSVTDFFYQSWKRGLHSYNSKTYRKPPNQRNYQYYAVPQPVCYIPPVVYVSTVVYQHYPVLPFMQQVGYRPDGTYGVLPTYWTYYSS